MSTITRLLCRHKSTVPRYLPPPKPIRNPTPVKNGGYFKITMMRSTIGLPKRIGETARSLGFHRRFQTVYHPHSSSIAGKILALKELVAIENVRKEEVKTVEQMNSERKAERGYVVLGRRAEENAI